MFHYDGQNAYSDAYGYYFNTYQKELWVRFYIRYQPGFTWSGGSPNYHKWMYLDAGSSYSSNAICELKDGDYVNVFSISEGQIS